MDPVSNGNFCAPGNRISFRETIPLTGTPSTIGEKIKGVGAAGRPHAASEGFPFLHLEGLAKAEAVGVIYQGCHRGNVRSFLPRTGAAGLFAWISIYEEGKSSLAGKTLRASDGGYGMAKPGSATGRAPRQGRFPGPGQDATYSSCTLRNRKANRQGTSPPAPSKAVRFRDKPRGSEVPRMPAREYPLPR